jgi:hypothetical protein
MLGIPSGNAKVHIGPELVAAVSCERIHTKDWLTETLLSAW